MSDLLGIGASGVRAYQSALTTVSDNISNATTAGYTRRATTLNEVVSAGGVTSGAGISGGVVVAGIARLADAGKAADVRASSADLAKSEAGVTTLTGIQGALTGNAINDRLAAFFNAATAVAADPTASAPRSTMLEAANSVAGAFTATGKALDNVAADLDATAENGVETLTSLGAALAKVNDGLGRATAGTSGAAGLQDQRDQILDQMSAISDVSVATDAAGRATVRLGGASGPTLVSGSNAGAVTYVRDGGSVSFAVHYAGEISTLTPNGGALAGVSDGAGRIADARGQLDAIASSFTSGVNAVQAQGADLNGAAGAAMFATGTTPTDITLTLTDPSGIAAAAVGAGKRDNSNLTALASLRSSGAFEADTTTLVAGSAATLASRKTIADAQSSIRDGAVAARDAVGGVNLDNEAVDLMRFQQAYSASSRIIQVARDTFQSILEIR
jgi:flagellar hook-associated protein 1 FlgK